MDETKETPKDSLPQGKAPEGSEGTTPKVEVKTHTEEETAKQVQAALVKAGRDAKSLSEKEAALTAERGAIEAEKTKIAEWERRREQAELEEARRDPDKLAAWQKKQTEKTRDAEFAKREQDLARREAEQEARVRATQEAQLGMKVYEIAARYDLNPEELRKDMKDLNLTTLEQLEKYAKRMSTTGERPPGGEGAKVTTAPITVPTSGVTSGGGKLTNEQLDKLSMEDYAAHRKKQTS